MQRSEVLTYYSVVGSFTGGQVNQGFIFITMKPPKERPLLKGHHETQAEFMQIVRKQFSEHPGGRPSFDSGPFSHRFYRSARIPS